MPSLGVAAAGGSVFLPEDPACWRAAGQLLLRQLAGMPQGEEEVPVVLASNQEGHARETWRMKEGNHIFFLFSIFSRIELAQERPTISAKNSSDTFTFIVIPGSVLNGNDISLIITNKS